MNSAITYGINSARNSSQFEIFLIRHLLTNKFSPEFSFYFEVSFLHFRSERLAAIYFHLTQIRNNPV